jgi:rubrerythrin
MNTKLEELIQHSIALEINVHKLYLVFGNLFPEDSKFWNQLAGEELNHAAILRKVLSYCTKDTEVPVVMLDSELTSVIDNNKFLSGKIEEFNQDPTLKKAYNLAIEAESIASERNYEKFMRQTSPDKTLSEIFQKLNGEENEHLERIVEYFKEKIK